MQHYPSSLPTPRAATTPLPLRDPLPPVTTMLTAPERARVDAAGEGLYHAMHRDSLDDVMRDLKERGAGAVLVSVARCGEREAARVAAVVREFPRVTAVALLTQVEADTPHAVLTLGRSGVKTLVDVRQPSGWRELRNVLSAERPGGAIQRAALSQLADDLEGAPEDCLRFFETLFTCGNRVSTVRLLAKQLAVLPSTLMSRFFRARLPAPKRYLATARLCRTASLFENPGLSVANVALALDYSSPQSFGRHVRTLLGTTAVDFRHRYDGEGMLQRFRDELVLPYRDVLMTFTPLNAPPGWMGRVKR
jgi:AraC-like DNA-binding protein